MKACAVFLLALLSSSTSAFGTKLTLELPGSRPVERSTQHYRCDGKALKTGLGRQVISVQYINAAGNSLAIINLNGSSLIFANVWAGSGARYQAAGYTWWESHGDATLELTGLSGEVATTCKGLD